MLKTVLFKSFARDTRGVAAIEYVVISSGIAVALIGSVAMAGTQLSSTFKKVKMDGGAATASSTGKPVTPVWLPVAIAEPVAAEPIADEPVAIAEAVALDRSDEMPTDTPARRPIGISRPVALTAE